MLLRRESEKETGREFLLFFPPPRFASLFLFFLKKEFGTANSFFRFFTHTSGTQEEKKRIERK